MNGTETAIANLLAEHTLSTGQAVAEIIAYRDGDGYVVKVKESQFQNVAPILGDVWIRAFLRDQGYNTDQVGRVVIDAQLQQPLRIYVEYLGKPSALEFHPFDLKLAEVVGNG